MRRPDIEGFLAEAVQEEPGVATGLSLDELYGVYTSWCLLNNIVPEASEALWEALRAHGINPNSNHLVMRGPAAADYIIASAPSILSSRPNRY